MPSLLICLISIVQAMNRKKCNIYIYIYISQTHKTKKAFKKMNYLAWVLVRVSLWNRNLVEDEELTEWEWGIESVSVDEWEWRGWVRVERVRQSGDWVRVERVSESGEVTCDWAIDLWIFPLWNQAFKGWYIQVDSTWINHVILRTRKSMLKGSRWILSL